MLTKRESKKELEKMSGETYISTVILAAGKGERFGNEKQYINLNGKTILQHSIDTFRACPEVNEIVVVVNDVNKAKKTIKNVDKIIKGGERRQDSSYNGLLACNKDTDYVLIHDAARPLVSREIIERVIEHLKKGYDCVCAAVPETDTISIVDDDKKIIDIPPRRYAWRHQTPQGFKYKKILEAYESTPRDITFTDDVSVFKYAGYDCHLVRGDYVNIKITTPPDLFIAERLSQWKGGKIKVPDVSGKKILVFGGTGGIGSEVVKILKDLGANVYGMGKKDADISGTTLPEHLYNVEWDCIVHCAGVLRKNDITLDSLKDFDEIFRINTRSLILVCDLAMKTMKKGGNIVVVGSSAAWKGRKGYTYYSASKAALNNLVEGLAEELMPYNIKINCVNPARTLTESIRTFYPDRPASEFLDPHYVAKVIVSYCDSEETGQIINIRKGVKTFKDDWELPKVGSDQGQQA